MKKIRIGYGYDVHKLTADIPLYLGGVNIPFYKGFEAHSDGDVLIHAVCDALLGALALGDIGKYFPNTDEQFKNADSKSLLAKCMALAEEQGYVVGNVDVTVCLEEPKILQYVPQMKEVLSVIMDVAVEDVSIKATTKEGLGYVGEGSGGEASAVVLLLHKTIAGGF